MVTTVTSGTTSMSTIPISTVVTDTTPGSTNSTPARYWWLWVDLGVVALGGIITIVLVFLRKKR
jgi:apolipoprotein N-acyltransferase